MTQSQLTDRPNLFRTSKGLFVPTADLFGPDYDRQVLLDAPVGYWPSGETSGSTLADRSGNGRNLTLTGATSGTRTPTPFSGASPNYDGASDYAASSSVTWWSASSGATIEAWVYVDAIVGGMAGGINSVFGDLASTSNGALIRANSVSGSSLPMTVYFGTSASALVTPATYTLTTGRVYHLVGRFDGTTAKLYVDGTEVSSVSFGARTTTFNMATKVASSEGSRWLDGTVHHCALYASALSPARILAHYNTAYANAA